MSARKIILIEDQEEIRDGLRDIFELEGFNVLTAANGKEGLEVTRANLDSCAIVLDIQMPIMNGWEYLKEFRKIAPAEAPPSVIVISAFSDAAEKAKQESVDYFKKPVNIDALLKVVSKYCP